MLSRDMFKCYIIQCFDRHTGITFVIGPSIVFIFPQKQQMATNQDDFLLQYFPKNNDNADILIIIICKNCVKDVFIYSFEITKLVADFI